ncbi:hypothetical protein R1flu_009391 [Riccia fluitans]|uniref:Uncharacterized protein n=1 Tax=Riccia fluitans TaxID=41844 RepID=A0ABD1Z1Y3_9MARC
MSRGLLFLCLLYLLLLVSPTIGVTERGKEVVEEEEGLPRTMLSRNRGVRRPENSVSGGNLKCAGLYSYCYSDWDCCSTWCNGWCYCLSDYDYCYYDYECCSGWCDRYYGCIYPYAKLGDRPRAKASPKWMAREELRTSE